MIKKGILEHEIDSAIDLLKDLKDAGISQRALNEFYKKELKLQDKFIDYILHTYHLNDHKIKQYTKQIKDLLDKPIYIK